MEIQTNLSFYPRDIPRSMPKSADNIVDSDNREDFNPLGCKDDLIDMDMD
jgi:hypothetical protein